MKQKLLFLSLVGLSLFADAQQKKKITATCPQKEYTINGYIEGLTRPYIYFIMNGKQDSILVKNGKFSYKGSLTEPCLAYLTDRASFSTTFYIDIENVPITIQGKITEPDNFKITGGKTQQENELLKASTKTVDDKKKQLYKKYREANKAKDSTAFEDIENELERLTVEEKQLVKAFISSHPKSYSSLNNLGNLTYSTDYPEMNRLFQLLDPILKNSATGKKLKTAIEILKRGDNGQKMIDFTQKDLSGNPVSFSSFKGKYVLVDFWASWCGPCRAENPNVLKAYQKFSTKGFTVIGVSLDDDAEKWKKAVEEDKMSWTQVSDLKGFNNELSTYYGIKGIPSNYLVDPNGVIIAKNLRGKKLMDKLQELIK